MAWFKVDDGLHDHRKTRKVRRSHPEKRRDVAPFGIWVLAGSWAGANGTSGFVPTEVLEEWDDDAAELAQRLVAAGLWWPTVEDGEPGYGFHDWEERNPASEVDSGKFGNHLRWHVNRKIANPDCPFCLEASPSIGANRGDDRAESGTSIVPTSSPVPTRPDPTPSNALAEVEREFAEWYEEYPRKRGRGQALKAYKGARKKIGADVLLAKLRQQIPTLTAKGDEYVPYPATWLNGERWDDEPPRPAPVRHLPHASELETPPDGLSPEEYAAWDRDRRARRRA